MSTGKQIDRSNKAFILICNPVIPNELSEAWNLGARLSSLVLPVLPSISFLLSFFPGDRGYPDRLVERYTQVSVPKYKYATA